MMDRFYLISGTAERLERWLEQAPHRMPDGLDLVLGGEPPTTD